MSQTRAQIDDLQRRVQGMLVRGTVRSVDDALMMQALDLGLEHGHRPTKVEHFQPYGFHYHPIAGDKTDALVAALGGNRDHLAVLGVSDRRFRPKNLGAGEVQLYHHEGATITLKNGRDIHMKTGTSEIIMRPGEIEFKAGAVKHTKA